MSIATENLKAKENEARNVRKECKRSGVLGLVHHTHSAAGELLDDPVVGCGSADY